jgi:hypothetical protein
MDVTRNQSMCMPAIDATQAARRGIIAKPSAVRSSFMAAGLVLMSILSGCMIGPKVYESSFNDYNDAIRKTSDGQMLSNLVRMRYLESPIFLQVSSVSSSFSVGGSAGASGTFISGGNDQAGVNAGGSYSENPTITFSLPESRKYYGMLMAPLSSFQILQLVDGGWNSRDVLRTGLRGMNNLKNSTTEYSTYPWKPPSHADFHEALMLIEKLAMEGLVELKAAGAWTIWSTAMGPVGKDPLAQTVLAAAAVYAKDSGADLVENADGKYDLHAFTRRMFLGFAPAAANSPDAQRLKSLLQLDPNRSSYPIRDFEFTAAEKALSYGGDTPATLNPESIWGEVGVRGRSMMEIMQIASTNVQVPQEDIDNGIVFVNPSSSAPVEDGMFIVKSSKDEPTTATVRTRYRGNWFYIEDNDLQSRQSFALLNAMFAVTAGTVPGANPVLTIPVN